MAPLRQLVCVALALWCSCSSAASPERVVRELSEAARLGQNEQVYRRLGPQTRERLAREARRASELGDRQVPPAQMLATGWLRARFSVVHTRMVMRKGDQAIVEVSGGGMNEQVRCVRAPGSDDWRVEIE